ncbi:MAG TPA: hypothetical protein VLH77_04445, partial [Gammaproteobacteria bacterium]|nr:hypothetical protein [Gammaproteobacteria bacterium]
SISPLTYSFKVYDTYMWKTVFLARIEKIEDKEKKEQYLKKFYEQMQKQEEEQTEEKPAHNDLRPLFEAYAEFERQYQRWAINREISNQDLDNAWYNLGKKQKEFLPVHMLKEFSREGNNRWTPSTSFNVDQMPRPSNQIYNNLILSDADWGVSFTLIRSWLKEAIVAAGSWLRARRFMGAGAAVSYDSAAFLRLFEVRRKDFTTQLSLMSQNALEKASRCKPSNPPASINERTRPITSVQGLSSFYPKAYRLRISGPPSTSSPHAFSGDPWSKSTASSNAI